jgi:hypothetical protein
MKRGREKGGNAKENLKKGEKKGGKRVNKG